MCGIAGVINVADARQTARKMSAALIHRGPDGQGLWSDEADRVALAHRRLAIIDLSDRAAQPMGTLDGRYVLTYNGEIYNFQDLRAELERTYGRQFRSGSDTEVLLNGWAQWGPSVVERLNGMFAFCMYDRLERTAYLVRDRLGVKPLYWSSFHAGVAFASELRAFAHLPDLDKSLSAESTRRFLQLGYVPGPSTIISAVHKLPPASIMTVKEGGKCLIRRYWSIDSCWAQPRLEPESECSYDDLCQILIDSFRRRIVADVPVGLYLSGGIDSAVVATLLTEAGIAPHAFTLAIAGDGSDESDEARETARILGIQHTVETFSVDDLKNNIWKIADVFDEPLADTSALPTIAVSEAAARHVKVVLSADGADEFFGGYRRYVWSARLEHVLRFVPREVLRGATRAGVRLTEWLRVPSVRRRLSKMADVAAHASAVGRYSEWNAVTGHSDLQLICPGNALSRSPQNSQPARSLLDACMASDVCSYLVDDILMKVDRATMAASIEGRDPFLDFRIAEYAARMPAPYKIVRNSGKHPLRHILRRRGVIGPTRRRKRGFSLPIARWMRKDWQSLINETVTERSVRDLPGVDPKGVSSLIKRFDRGDPIVIPAVYALLCLCMWRARWAP